MLRLKTALVCSPGAILMAAAWSPASAAVNCADLANLKILASEIGLPSGGATIISAQMATVPADPLNPGATRDYCKVLGAVEPIDPNAPPVNFEVNLPVDWNGKAVQYGGGGSNGVLITGLAPLRDARRDTPVPVARGFAMKIAVRETVELLQEKAGLTAAEAYSVASLGVDFRIAEAVDSVQVIYGTIPKKFFKQNPDYWANKQ